MVRLDSDTSFLKQNMLGTVIGWSNVVANPLISEGSDELNIIDVCVTPYDKCAAQFPITNNLFCASANQGASCNGDLGGSMVIKVDAGSDLQVGVASFATQGCVDNTGGYACISHAHG